LATTGQRQTETGDEATASVASAMSVLCGYKGQGNLANRQRTTAVATLGCKLASIVEEQHQRPAHGPDLLHTSTCLTQQTQSTTEFINRRQHHVRQATEMLEIVTASVSGDSS